MAEPAQRGDVMLVSDEGVHAAEAHGPLAERHLADAPGVFQQFLASQELLANFATGRHVEIVASRGPSGQLLAIAQACWWWRPGRSARMSASSRRETTTWPKMASTTMTPGSQT